MGICESSNNKTKSGITTKETTEINKKIKKDVPIKTIQTIEKTGRVKECLLEKSPFEKINRYFSNVSKSICKIKIETIKETYIEKKSGTGFLLKKYIDQELFYCLISNEHVISKDIINNNNSTIYISYDNEFKIMNIKLNTKERYIKSFIDIGLDITVIEILLDKDNISKEYFLFPEIEMENNRLINSKVYIPQYAKGKELVNARGEIKEINEYEFTHLVSTEQGSSGSPIFLENSIDVIGIHKESNKNKSENYADFIYPAINIIRKDIREKRNKGKYENGKYIWEDGKYYMGEFKKNIPYGKGIKYYKNGNILYEGEFINGKFEGNGKYIYDDGEYYIGQYKNGLRNGKGTIYYTNGKIKIEGDWINGELEGNGKYIWENGEYYIGQWLNGKRHGKGKEYYKNGDIKYDGDFVNDKYEGNGKYIWENGEYYIGQWKNGLRNGKGTMYYANGKIKYEGDWIDDKFVEN